MPASTLEWAVLVGLIMWLFVIPFIKGLAGDPSEPSATPSGAKIINTRIAGVTFSNPDGVSRQLLIRRLVHDDLVLQLRREPDNLRDPNAIAVWCGRSQLGYIPAEVVPRLKAAKVMRAVVYDFEPPVDDDEISGVQIKVEWA